MCPEPLNESERPSIPAGWGVGLHAWLERSGRAVLGPGRLELLEAIDRHRSISAAARGMGMSYRHAWVTVQRMNEAAGEPLVVAATGGTHGGGARLTPLGRWAVSTFRGYNGQLHSAAAAMLPTPSDEQEIRSAEEHPPATRIHVAAAVSLEEALGRILNDFAQERPDIRVRAVFGASDELAEQLLAGAHFDLFLAAAPGLLERLRQVGAPVVFARNGLAWIGLAGRELHIRRPSDLAREGVRLALAGPGCPLGDYSRDYLERLRLYQPLVRRAVQADNSRSVVAAVRSGQADAGLVYASDAARADGCRTLLRSRVRPDPVYAGAVLASGVSPEAAQALLHFLSSPRASKRFRECGFHPTA